MAEIFGIVASVVNIADLSVHAASSLSILLNSWRCAPALVLQLNNEAADLAVVLDLFRTAAQRTINGDGLAFDPRMAKLVQRILAEAEEKLAELEDVIEYLQTANSGTSRRKRWVARQRKVLVIKEGIRELKETIRDVFLTSDIASSQRIELQLQGVDIALRRIEKCVNTGLTRLSAELASSSAAKCSAPTPKKSSASSPLTSVDLLLPGHIAMCIRTCPCACHLYPVPPTTYRIPSLLQPLLGALFLGYTATPKSNSPRACNHASCAARDRTKLTVHYVFPRWFLSLAVHAVYTSSARQPPTLGLLLRRLVQADKPGTLHYAVASGDADLVARILAERPASVSDLDAKGGASVLMAFFRGGNRNPAVLRLLVTAGAEFDVEAETGSCARMVAMQLMLPRARKGSELEDEVSRSFRLMDYVHLFEFTELIEAIVGLRLPFDLNDAETAKQVNTPDVNGKTPLHWAGRFDNAEAVSALLRAGADVEAKDCTGYSPLCDAVHSRADSATAELIRAGADARVQNRVGQTPLTRVIECGAAGSLGLLLDCNRVSLTEEVDDRSLIEMALWWDQRGILEALKSRRAVLRPRGNIGPDEITLAIIWNSHACLRYLLVVEEKRRIRDWVGAVPLENEGWTDLHYIAAHADVDTIQILRTGASGLKNADIYRRTAEGKTPAMIFAEREMTYSELREAWDFLLLWIDSKDII